MELLEGHVTALVDKYKLISGTFLLLSDMKNDKLNKSWRETFEVRIKQVTLYHCQLFQ